MKAVPAIALLLEIVTFPDALTMDEITFIADTLFLEMLHSLICTEDVAMLMMLTAVLPSIIIP